MSRKLENQIFDRLTVIRLLGSKDKRRFWLCKCVCGEETTATTNMLLTSAKRSCGCLAKERFDFNKTHGFSSSKEHLAWTGMKQRCYNKKEENYKNYGARGISVCERWRDSFENFYLDMGQKPSSKHSLDRIDVNGNYCPENCRWADRSTQSHNVRPRTNRTEFPGVGFKENRYFARIQTNGKRFFLGSFDSAEEAFAEYKKAKASILNPKTSTGESEKY